MLLGYDPVDLLLALAAGFGCGFLNTAASSGSVVTLPIMIFLGLDPATANATNRLPVLVGAAFEALHPVASLSVETSQRWRSVSGGRRRRPPRR